MSSTTINDNLIVFESNPDFSDNSRGLWEYVTKNTSYDTFWVIKDKNTFNILKSKGIPCGIKGSEITEKMISTAKFLVTTSFEFADSKKIGQIHISAWHGFPLKVIGFFDSASAAIDTTTYNNLKLITTQCDLVTASSRLSQLTLSGFFAVDPRKVKNTGFPRNDIMFNSNSREYLAKITNVDISNSKLIIYLPTMRRGLKDEGEQFTNNIFNYKDYNPDLIDKFLEKNNAYIFTKLHFADNCYYTKNNFKLPKRLIFLNTQSLTKNLLTIYHILNAFDILITDYSSVYVDYLLLNKPIIFSCPDIEKYRQERGFVIDNPVHLMPGEIVKNQSSLLKTIESIFSGNDNFKSLREEKMDLFHTHKDSNSSKRLFEEMIKLSNGNFSDCSKSIGKYYYPNASILYQYTLTGEAKFYFDLGKGFEEEHKTVLPYIIEPNTGKVSFNISIPKNTKNIRFDPDNNNRWILKDLSVYLDEDKTTYFLPRNSYKKIDDEIYFNQPKPQIIINLDKEYHSLKINYICIDLYKKHTHIIDNLFYMKNKLEATSNELNRITIELNKANDIIISMINSKSWKITKPLRNAVNFLKNKRHNHK